MSAVIIEEVRIFINVIALGMVMQIVYDIIRIFRRLTKRGIIIVAIEDILYWIVASFAIFYYSYEVNNGKFRVYILVGVFLGMILFEISIGKYFVSYVSKWLLRIKRIRQKYLKKIRKIVIKALKKIVKPFKIEKDIFNVRKEKMGIDPSGVLRDRKRKEK